MSKAWDKAEKGAAARQYLIQKGWPAGAVAALPEDAIGLDTEHEKGPRLLMPLRIDDEVVDVVALGDEGLPRRRGRGRQLPILGSIDEAVIHGTANEPIFIAVRPDDYLLAQCIVAQRRGRVAGHGVVIGVSAVGGLQDLLALFQKKVKPLELNPGGVELWPVRPNTFWRSNLGLVRGEAWRLTWTQMRDELVQALDWARVRLPSKPPEVFAVGDPAGCWAMWDAAPLLVDPGEHDWRRTKRFPGTRLRGVALLKACTYRLPLAVAVRATYWRLDTRTNSEVKTTTPSCTDYDLGDLVATWLETHGVTTWRDKKGREWCYWDRRLMDISSKDFKATLFQVAHLNDETRAGRVVLSQVKVAARADRQGRLLPEREVHAWCWSDTTDDGTPISAIALGDKDDRVVVVKPGKMTIEPNARTVVLKRPPAAIDWLPVTAAEWSRLLYDKMGRWLTCEPALRLLEVSWCVMALMGRRHKQFAPVRPILWPIGPAGSAKSYTAEMVQAWFFGTRLPKTAPTPASLQAQAQDKPIFAIDNAETAMRTPQMVQLLLTAFLGAERSKMAMNTDSEVIDQPIEAWFMLTSIEGGGIHELINRSLFVRHDVHQWGDPEHDGCDPPEDMIQARSALIAGTAGAWAEHILPRLVAGEAVETVKAYREPYRLHPLSRQLKTLAALAIVADVLATLDPRWGVGGVAALDRWLAVLGEETGEMLNSVDPVGGALRALLDDFNAIDIGPMGPWQPLVETERVPVVPIFANAKGGVTLHKQWAQKRRARGSVEPNWPIVIGFMGTYSALHATLYDRTRSRGVGYTDRIPTADILSKRMRHTIGWTTLSKVSRDGRDGHWLHAWVLDEAGRLVNAGTQLKADFDQAKTPEGADWNGTEATS